MSSVKYTSHPRRSPPTMSRPRPIALLLGWLGCQPRNLRRFVDLYNTKGYDSIVRVASPESIISAVEQGPSIDFRSNSMNAMYHQAFDILRELQVRRSPQVIVHIFSNGGCFLWEWLAHILQHHQHVSWNDTNVDVKNIRCRLIGRVLDSAPANYEGRPDGIISALQHIKPISEKNRLLGIAEKVHATNVNLRHDKFWKMMLNDNYFEVPELYLYSENDKLTSYEPLRKLINEREKLLGKEHVWSHNFLDSEHCGHLLKYPEQYDSILGQFVASCSKKKEIASKL